MSRLNPEDTFHTDENFVDVRGNADPGLFEPAYFSPAVWMTDDRLEISYSVEYGFRTEVVATITRTSDGYTLVGAHSTFDRKVQKDTSLDEVPQGLDPRDALLLYAGRVDALTAEFIIPQVVRRLEEAATS